jgi:hypothetical protein
MSRSVTFLQSQEPANIVETVTFKRQPTVKPSSKAF